MFLARPGRSEPINLVAFNGIDDGRGPDLGHMFHTQFCRGVHDTEAIGRMIGYAFEHLDIRSIIAKNAEDWPGQLAPLKKLGLKVTGRGKGSFHKDADGKPIEFISCRMEITKEEWLHRDAKGKPKATE